MDKWQYKIFGVIGRKGEISKATAEAFNDAIKKEDRELSPYDIMPRIDVSVFYCSNLDMALKERSPYNVAFIPDNDAFDTLLLNLHRNGLTAPNPNTGKRTRRFVGRVNNNVSREFDQIVTVYLTLALWECGVRYQTHKNAYSSTAVPHARVVEAFGMQEQHPTAVTISIVSSVMPLPVIFCMCDAVNGGKGSVTIRNLRKMRDNALSEGLAAFVVCVLLDTMYVAAVEGTYRRRVFFHTDSPEQRAVVAASKGALKGALFRMRCVPTADCFPVCIITNACGPYMDVFESVVRDLVTSMGAKFVGLQTFEQMDSEKKN
jgi:hypothetical protein